MFCVKIIIALKRLYVKCLVDIYDVHDPQESDKEQLRQTSVTREE